MAKQLFYGVAFTGMMILSWSASAAFDCKKAYKTCKQSDVHHKCDAWKGCSSILVCKKSKAEKKDSACQDALDDCKNACNGK